MVTNIVGVAKFYSLFDEAKDKMINQYNFHPNEAHRYALAYTLDAMDSGIALLRTITSSMSVYQQYNSSAVNLPNGDRDYISSKCK